MSLNTIKTFFWTTFVLAIIILFLNVGLGLVAFGIVILPMLVSHFIIGLRLDKLQERKPAIVFSSINLVAFALVRPDGVHVIAESGLSSLLDIFGINGGYDSEYENYFAFSALALFLVQLLVDFILQNRLRKNA